MKMIFILFLACICVIAAHPTGVNLTNDGVSRFNVTLIGVLYNGINGCSENFVSFLQTAARDVLRKKEFLEISQNSQENRHAVSLKKRLWLRCFPVNFGKYLRAPFLQIPG